MKNGDSAPTKLEHVPMDFEYLGEFAGDEGHGIETLLRILIASLSLSVCLSL